MARKPASRRMSPRRTFAADPLIFGPKLRAAGFVACDEEPIECRASVDATGGLWRVHARYPNGWRCTLLLRKNGAWSLSQTLSQTIRLTTKPTPNPTGAP